MAQVPSPLAGLPSKAGLLPVQTGPRPGRRSRSGVRRPRAGRAANSSDRSAASPAARRTGVGRRLGHVRLGEQRPINGKKQGRHANGDHASECDQGGGDDKTQMRVQGPSPSGRPRAAPIPGKNNGGGGTMSVWGAGSQRKSKLCLTRRGPWGQGAGGSKLRLGGKALQSGLSSDSGRPDGVCQTPRSTLDWSQQRRLPADI